MCIRDSTSPLLRVPHQFSGAGVESVMIVRLEFRTKIPSLQNSDNALAGYLPHLVLKSFLPRLLAAGPLWNHAANRSCVSLGSDQPKLRSYRFDIVQCTFSAGMTIAETFRYAQTLCFSFQLGPNRTTFLPDAIGVAQPSCMSYGDVMQIFETGLFDVKIIRPKRHGDSRGWFAETFNREAFRDAGLPGEFAQDNQSFSVRGVLRGLHYQLERPQGKLVRVLSGHIWDVAVDLRRSSPDFGKWAGFHLQPLNAAGEMEMLWIPEGFAHGFLVLSETAEVFYKATRTYFPAGERCIVWNDPSLAIAWPLDDLAPAVSAKDAQGATFAAAELP